MSRPRDRRHGPSERDSPGSERPSPLGAGWPPLTTLYSRISEDLSEPPLVNGRPPVKDPECPLCTLGEDLGDRGYDPDQAAWAEREVVLAIHRGRGPASILGELSSSHGLEVSEAALEKHVTEHVPSSELQDLERMRGWDGEEFNGEAWRGLFDMLYLVVERTRQGVASGDLAPTIPEGLSASKTLGELLSHSVGEESQGEAQSEALGQMQMFLGVLQGVIEDGVADPAERETLFRRLQEAFEHQEETIGDSGAEPAEGISLPRGRERSPGQSGSGKSGEDGDTP